MSPAGTTPTGVDLALTGRLADLDPGGRRLLLDRTVSADGTERARVAEILTGVRGRGDAELIDLARRLDRVQLEELEVTQRAWQTALEQLRREEAQALRAAARSIEQAHRDHLPRPTETRPRPGLTVGRRPVPLRRIGAYAPGGRASYPSCVPRCFVRAGVAGVDEIVVCAPPGADGRPAPAVLAACALAGADRLFAVGGAGAVAAMAFGTESIPAVDKIVGPGSVWVAEAKLQVSRAVAIDCPAGPSEVLVIADGDADADRVAAELLAQAEHDPRAAAVLLTPDTDLAGSVESALARGLAGLETAPAAREALATRGAVLVCGDLAEALAFAEEYAPEHLLLLCAGAEEMAATVRSAGTVLFGAGAGVAYGDYATGANHVLPTGRRARTYSGLGVQDFIRWQGWQRIEPSAGAALAPVAERLAGLEGLPAHAAAARIAARAPVVVAAGGGKQEPVTIPVGVRAARRYEPGPRQRPVELSDNTNLFGTAPGAAAVLRAAVDDCVRRYPSVYGDRLKQALAADLGVPPECIATGCGSDDLLDSAFRAFAGPQGRIAFSDPTFSMVRAFGTVNGARLLPVACDETLVPDIRALATADADVVYLCRPDNPSGLLVSGEELDMLLESAAGTVVLDEAYVQYADTPSLAARAASTPGLVVLRTFSKAWGMAGLRVGFAVGTPTWIDLLERARGPYKVSSLAEEAAAAALRGDGAWLRQTVDRARRARERLAAALRLRGLHVWPSAANFVLFRVPAGDASALAAKLDERGIGVRPFPGLPGGGGIRVTAGPDAMMERFLEALDGALAQGGGKSDSPERGRDTRDREAMP